MSQLPLDVLTIILSLVPPVRDTRETSGRILLNCLQVNSLFHEAASLPFLWKPHYEIRYEHCREELERARSEESSDITGIGYREALKLLDKFISTRVGMQDVARALVRQSLDVWDVLELECSWPVPYLFGSQTTRRFEDELRPNDTICRRFWAAYFRDTIARASGVSLWRRFIPGSSLPALEAPSFELAMSSISTMFGVSDKTITKELDSLANLCRGDLVEKRVSVDFHEPDYDLVRVCSEMCHFMRGQGFSRYIQSPWGGDNSWDILNKFPHIHLTTHKDTIPISLVHIFIEIATRLDIDAYPVNFPRVVLSYVRPHEQGGEVIIVNPSARDLANVIIGPDTPYNDNPVQQAQVFSPNVAAVTLIPCDAAMMLIRACYNIAATLPRNTTMADAHASALLVLCVNLMFQAETNVLRELFVSADLRLLDCIFLLDELAPYLRPRCKQHLETMCQSNLEDIAITVGQESRRKPGVVIQFFVGMAFVHAQYGYTGFIVGWDVSSILALSNLFNVSYS